MEGILQETLQSQKPISSLDLLIPQEKNHKETSLTKHRDEYVQIHTQESIHKLKILTCKEERSKKEIGQIE